MTDTDNDCLIRWLAVAAFFIVAMLSVFKAWNLQSELQQIHVGCDVYEDGSAECQDGTFDWEDN